MGTRSGAGFGRLSRATGAIGASVLDVASRTHLYSWPAGIDLGKFATAAQRLTMAYSRRQTLRYKGLQSRPQIPEQISREPRLRFHSYYSFNRVEHPTPCAWQLASDLRSCTSLKGKKILALGARNQVELDQLVLFGATRELITGVDLYANVPGIVAMDFHNLEFIDDSFDVVFWAGSFAYSEDPTRAASEGRRVLKAGGILAVGDTLRGGATAPQLESTLAGTLLQDEVKASLGEASETHSVFTIEVGTSSNLLNYFFDDGSDELLLLRNYLPCHANVILTKGGPLSEKI